MREERVSSRSATPNCKGVGPQRPPYFGTPYLRPQIDPERPNVALQQMCSSVPSNTGYWSNISTQCWTNIGHDIGLYCTNIQPI